MIISELEDDIVKTTIYPSEVTAEKAGEYNISLSLKDDVSAMSTKVSLIVNIEYEGKTSEEDPAKITE